MDQSADRNVDKQNSPKAVYLRYLVSFPTLVCFVLSLSSIAVCFLMTFKTHQMEGRIQELEIKLSDFCQDSSVSKDLRTSIETLLQERLNEAMPKLRVARDVTQECNCPPGPPGKRGRKGDPGESYFFIASCLFFC
ncbi:collagen alpha-1(XXIII) chain [Paramisgurnus dabryanus]|uniref:collagen alpha-1(XXIII) chain n=1 Tax=Paramisgurnus dabryanus TaxID=90735 RepID=UPI003CCFDEA0